MDESIKSKAKEIIMAGSAKTIMGYTKNALLINACFVSSERYATLKSTKGLSTTQNIPAPLRLEQEIDYVYTNEQLVSVYKSSAIDVILKNYLVMSISIIDAMLEEVYELFISHFEFGISEMELSKKVRCAWINDSMINYFMAQDKSNLKKPSDMQTTFEEFFIRYKELRIIRHAIIHSEGVIGQKNMDTLNDYKLSTPNERKHFCLIDSPIIKNGNEVVLTVNSILSIRQYLHRFIIYFLKSIEGA